MTSVGINLLIIDYLFTQEDVKAKTKGDQEDDHEESKLTYYYEYLCKHYKEYPKGEWKLFQVGCKVDP